MKANIKQIKIRAAGKMIAEIRQGDYVDENCSAAIYCTDVPLKASELKRLPCCCVQFIDTEDSRASHAFTREQAALIRDFLMSLPEQVTMLYCCCDWGQSRSAGLAAACMTALGQDCEWLFRCSSYSPNLLVYAAMCEALGCPPSAVELQKLSRLRYEAGRSNVQANHSVKRILVAGDSTLFPVIPAELCGVPVEMCGTNDTSIPYTEKELVADRKQLGSLLPGDLLLVIRGIRDLSVGLSPEEVAVRMRKYLLWLRYINPGVAVLLAAPPETLSGAKVSREQIAQLAGCYHRLADDLQVPVVDISDWNRNAEPQSLAEYLFAVINKGCINLQRSES